VEEGRAREHRYVRGAYVDQLVMGILREEFHALHGAGGREERNGKGERLGTV
jgi:hypothetical protein